MIFDNQRDASNRLTGTVVLWKDKSAKVVGVNEDLRIMLHRLSDGLEGVRKQDSKELQLMAPPLGYVNLKRGALYVLRKPVRMWKQGLDPRQLWCNGGGLVGIRTRWDGSEFAKCYDGDYPGIDEALKRFKSTNPFDQETPTSVAFSRQWAVDKAGRLHYKGRDVGRMGDNMRLDDKFGWLAEALEESLHEQG